MSTKSPATPHRWRFFRAGGFEQVKLETGADLMALDQLDFKLWVALACPTSGLEFDKATLELIDTDKDGRVRAPELLAAIKWAGAVLKNSDDLLKVSPTLPVAAIQDNHPEGKLIATFARQVLEKGDNDVVTVDEAKVAAKTFAAKPFNGDGIITTDSARDDATKAVINDIIACLGAENDASGKPGIGQARIDQFFKEAQTHSDWWAKAEADNTVLPLGLDTPGAAAAIKAVEGKISDFFLRCHLTSFDPRAMNAVNREEKDLIALAAKDLAEGAELAAFPLARVESGTTLPLEKGINPAWTGAIATLNSKVIQPLLGAKTTLNEADWRELLSKFAPYNTWSGSKPAGSVEKLGLTRLREILASKAKENLTTLVCLDQAELGHSQAASGLSRLAHYHRDLNRLCHNFVSFRDFYGRKAKAIFQAGTLYLDQRSCDLCLTVEDPGKHAIMAGLAGTYLAYCDCVRKGSGEKMHIVAAFTGGDSDNLMVGRNGVFFDRKGRDWDATITKIVDNPISIRQAFFSPYKKLVRMVEEQVAKRAATADAASTAQLQARVAGTAPAATAATKPAPAKIDTGTLAAIGLVLTTLLAALGTIFSKVMGLLWWQIPLAMLALIAGVSAPSVIMAYLKLHRRNLGPILDANGWAINARAKMNVPFGGALTGLASLPAGSQRDLVDPFAEKKSPWPKVLAVGAILVAAYLILNKLGYIYEWTDGRLGTEKILASEKQKLPADSVVLPVIVSTNPPANIAK